jgi:hypothetical protein
VRELHSLLHQLLTHASSNAAFERKARTVLVNLLKTRPANDEKSSGALTRFDIATFVREHGLLALRDYLERFPTSDLREYVRVEQLTKSGISKLAKAQVINRIMMAAKDAA